jgi:hypothetical protein
MTYDEEVRAIIEAAAWLRGATKPRERALCAQQTLARLLRTNSLSDGLRFLLADMFDPDGECNFRLVVKRRPRRPRGADDDANVGLFVSIKLAEDKSITLADAAEAAKKHFGVGRTKVFNAWKKWREDCAAAGIRIGKDGRESAK